MVFLERFHRHLDGAGDIGPVLEAAEAGAFLALLIHLALPEFDTFEGRLGRFLRVCFDPACILRRGEESPPARTRPRPVLVFPDSEDMAALAAAPGRTIGFCFALAPGVYMLMKRAAGVGGVDEWADDSCVPQSERQQS